MHDCQLLQWKLKTTERAPQDVRQINQPLYTVDFIHGADSAATSDEVTLGGIGSQNLFSPPYIAYEGATQIGISV